ADGQGPVGLRGAGPGTHWTGHGEGGWQRARGAIGLRKKAGRGRPPGARQPPEARSSPEGPAALRIDHRAPPGVGVSNAQGFLVNVLGMSVVGVVALLRHSAPLPSPIVSLPASIE